VTLYSLATETYEGSEINVDLFPTEMAAYESLARLIFAEPEFETRLNALLTRLRNDGRVVGYGTIAAFRDELDETRWVGVVQSHDYP
jgi:hypothetical protein